MLDREHYEQYSHAELVDLVLLLVEANESKDEIIKLLQEPVKVNTVRKEILEACKILQDVIQKAEEEAK